MAEALALAHALWGKDLQVEFTSSCWGRSCSLTPQRLFKILAREGARSAIHETPSLLTRIPMLLRQAYCALGRSGVAVRLPAPRHALQAVRFNASGRTFCSNAKVSAPRERCAPCSPSLTALPSAPRCVSITTRETARAHRAEGGRGGQRRVCPGSEPVREGGAGRQVWYVSGAGRPRVRVRLRDRQGAPPQVRFPAAARKLPATAPACRCARFEAHSACFFFLFCQCGLLLPAPRLLLLLLLLTPPLPPMATSAEHAAAIRRTRFLTRLSNS